MRTQILNKFYKTLLALSFVGGTAMLEMSCAKKKKNSLRDAGGNAEEQATAPGSNPAGTAADETGAAEEEIVEIKDLQPRVQLRDFNEINRTYSVLTGIPMADMQTVFEAQKTSLPGSNNPADIGGAKINSAKELAANYCNAMSLNDQLRTERFPGINFAGGAPAQVYANVETFAGMVIDHFWGTGLESLPDRAVSVAEMSLLINDLIT